MDTGADGPWSDSVSVSICDVDDCFDLGCPAVVSAVDLCSVGVKSAAELRDVWIDGYSGGCPLLLVAERNDCHCDDAWCRRGGSDGGLVLSVIWTLGLSDSPLVGCGLSVLTNHSVVYDGPMSVDSAVYLCCYNEVNGEDGCDGLVYELLRNGGVEGLIVDLVTSVWW